MSDDAKEAGVSYKTAHQWWKADQLRGYQIRSTGTIIIECDELRRYLDEGKIKSIKNPALQKLYDVESYIKGNSVRTPTIC